MDIALFKARANATREAWVTVNGVEYCLLIPRRLDVLRHMKNWTTGNTEFAMHELVVECVINWRGVTCAGSVVECDQEVMEAFLAENTNDAAELATALLSRYIERNKDLDASLKN